LPAAAAYASMPAMLAAAFEFFAAPALAFVGWRRQRRHYASRRADQFFGLPVLFDAIFFAADYFSRPS